jgi:hypothetical protein
MTRCNGVTTLDGGKMALGREKGGGDVSWADANLTGLKNKENPRGRFNW